MRKSRIIKRIAAMGILLTLVISAAGCKKTKSIAEGTSNQSEDLLKNVSASQTSPLKTMPENSKAAVNIMAADLFRQYADSDENTMISPISILAALGMTANGASENTLTEMENFFGMSVENVNELFGYYLGTLSGDEKCKIGIADSLWVNNNSNCTINDEFLKENKNWYAAGIYKTEFNEQAQKDINSWVKEKTDGMIDKIVDEIKKDSVMYLINAVVFDAKWQQAYDESDVGDGTFNAYDGSKQSVKYMHSTETDYLNLKDAQGFLKYYKGERYAFVGILPNEGVSLDSYMKKIDVKELMDAIDNPENENVLVTLPEFEFDFSDTINEKLKQLGMVDAFDEKTADFSRMGGEGSGIYIDEVLHKTHIEVSTEGTKAAAVTSVLMDNETCVMYSKSLVFDRPFVFLIYDCENDIPLFIGNVKTIE